MVLSKEEFTLISRISRNAGCDNWLRICQMDEETDLVYDAENNEIISLEEALTDLLDAADGCVSAEERDVIKSIIERSEENKPVKGTVVFDFDGVIHLYSDGWKNGSIYDSYDEEAVKAIKAYQMANYAVAISSTRDPEQIKAYCDENNLFKSEIMPFETKFWNKKDIVGITNRKIPAMVYIDDRAVKFDKDMASWELINNARELFEKKG